MTVEAFATWLPVAAPRAEPVDVFGMLPAAGALEQLYAGLWERGLDGATLDLCRTRVTSMITGTVAKSSAEPETSAQRAAVDFAEQFVLDPHGCTDEQMRALQAYFTAPQLATLTTAVAVFDALARARAVLSLPEEELT